MKETKYMKNVDSPMEDTMKETKDMKNVDSPMEDTMDSDIEEPKAVPVLKKRSRLLVLMGFPEDVNEDADEDAENKYKVLDDEEEEEEGGGGGGRRAKWNKVLNRLKSNPEEASICEDSRYPLDDALWVRSNPVPVGVVVRLIRTYPQAYTAQSYEIACNNPNTRPKVMKLLRGADVTGDIVEERPALLKLMGYPIYKWDNAYNLESVNPDWDAVRNRLVTHPGEAKIDEDGCFPLADALWIRSDPVPLDIVKSLIEICPEALTDDAFTIACHPKTCPEVLRLMFSVDRKVEGPVNSSASEDSYVKVD
jgi:hypothetical protein